MLEAIFDLIKIVSLGAQPRSVDFSQGYACLSMPSNVINTESQVKDFSEYSGNKLLIVIVILLPIQFICVFLRLFVRYHTKISFGLDDLVVIITMLGQIIWAGVVISIIIPEK